MQANIDSSVLEYLKSLALLCVEDNKTTQILYGSIFEDMVKKIIATVIVVVGTLFIFGIIPI